MTASDGSSETQARLDALIIKAGIEHKRAERSQNRNRVISQSESNSVPGGQTSTANLHWLHFCVQLIYFNDGPLRALHYHTCALSGNATHSTRFAIYCKSTWGESLALRQ
jgi:hypothetical protein